MGAIAPMISLPITQCSSSNSNAHITKPLPRVRTPVGRRVGTIATLGFLAASVFKQPAGAFDFGLVAPDQTLDEAVSGIRGHARGLLDIKEFIDSESWKDAQREMRMNAGYLKQDIYTIIQNKPGKERPGLRKMYSELFNDVTRLDYAARDMDKIPGGGFIRLTICSDESNHCLCLIRAACSWPKSDHGCGFLFRYNYC